MTTAAGLYIEWRACIEAYGLLEPALGGGVEENGGDQIEQDGERDVIDARRSWSRCG